MFSVHTTPEDIISQQSPVIFDLCLGKPQAGKSHDQRGVIVFKRLRFHIVFCPHKNEKSAFSNSSGLKSVFEKLRFHGEL